MSNEELQKAIDDITRESANDGAIPAAVPTDAAMPTSAMPSDMMPTDTDAASAMPTSDAASVAATAEPIAPPPAAPEVPPMPAEAVATEAPVAAEETVVAAEVEVPAAAPAASAQPDLGEGVTIGADGLIDVAPVETVEKNSNIPTEEPPANLIKVKQDTLRELFPLMNKLDIDPVEKFGIYKDIIDLTKEHSAIEEAHDVILQIPDEQARADALLELLEIIATFKV